MSYKYCIPQSISISHDETFVETQFECWILDSSAVWLIAVVTAQQTNCMKVQHTIKKGIREFFFFNMFLCKEKVLPLRIINQIRTTAWPIIWITIGTCIRKLASQVTVNSTVTLIMSLSDGFMTLWLLTITQHHSQFITCYSLQP